MTEYILGQSVLASCISIILHYQALYRNNVVNRCKISLLKMVWNPGCEKGHMYTVWGLSVGHEIFLSPTESSHLFLC